jgi:hypothetical protein
MKKLVQYTTDYLDFWNIILSWPISVEEERMYNLNELK